MWGQTLISLGSGDWKILSLGAKKKKGQQIMRNRDREKGTERDQGVGEKYSQGDTGPNQRQRK